MLGMLAARHTSARAGRALEKVWRDLDVLLEDDHACKAASAVAVRTRRGATGTRCTARLHAKERLQCPAIVDSEVGVPGELGEVRAMREAQRLAWVHEAVCAMARDHIGDGCILAVLRDENGEGIATRVTREDGACLLYTSPSPRDS